MASELSSEQKVSYSRIIDDILSNSDLNTISAKKIRKGLQDHVGQDLTPQKTAITDLIMVRFDKFQQHEQEAPTAAVPPTPDPEPKPKTNGTTSYHTTAKRETSSPPPKRKATSSPSEADQDDDLSSVLDSPPPAKKAKKAKSHTETDEEIAKRMQAELNAQSARSTRGGGTKRKTVVKKSQNKTPKKKSKAKINSDDDSDVEGSEKPEKERKGGFHKQMALSEPLAALVGESALSRPQTVKRIWAYVKERDLQDPADKRQIRCDDAMRAVFKQDRVHMFTMNKLLAQNLYPIEEAE